MINKAILIGNAGKDPEVKHLDNGMVVASFALATSDVYKDKEGNYKTATEWHNIVCWRGLAEVAEKHIHKGSQLYIEGKITTREWEDKEGQKKQRTEIVADKIKLLGKKPEGSSGTEPSASASTGSSDPAFDYQPVAMNLGEDDLPF